MLFKSNEQYIMCMLNLSQILYYLHFVEVPVYVSFVCVAIFLGLMLVGFLSFLKHSNLLSLWFYCRWVGMRLGRGAVFSDKLYRKWESFHRRFREVFLNLDLSLSVFLDQHWRMEAYRFQIGVCCSRIGGCHRLKRASCCYVGSRFVGYWMMGTSLVCPVFGFGLVGLVWGVIVKFLLEVSRFW